MDEADGVTTECENCGGEVPVGDTHSCPACGLDPLCPSCVCEKCPESEDRKEPAMKKKKKPGPGRVRRQLCTWCGRELSRSGCGTECSAVHPLVRGAVMKFAGANGRTWRARLRAEWERDCSGVPFEPDGVLLLEARDAIGPKRLARVEV